MFIRKIGIVHIERTLIMLPIVAWVMDGVLPSFSTIIQRVVLVLSNAPFYSSSSRISISLRIDSIINIAKADMESGTC